MDDLTKIKGIGKSTAAKLVDAGFGTYAQLAKAGTPGNLKTLQDAGFATVEIDRWALAAAVEVARANNIPPIPPPESDQGGAGDTASPAGGSDGTEEKNGATEKKAGAPGKKGSKRLVARQEIRHLGVTYTPGDDLPASVDAGEAAFLLGRGSAVEVD